MSPWVATESQVKGMSYALSEWSDAGAQSRDIRIGNAGQTLTASFAASPAGVRAVNLGPPAVMIDGVVWQSQAEAGVITNRTLVLKADLLLPPVASGERAAMLRTSRCLRAGLTVRVPQVANGSYDVFVSVVEDNFPVTFSLDLEGARVLTGASSGAGGSWSRLGPYRVQVEDGALDLKASAVSVNVAGVEIIPAP